MYAIIGRYKVRMEETGMILKHATGITFDLTAEETLGLLDFISPYRKTLLYMHPHTEVDTQPVIRIVQDDNDDLS
jgi:hypothetical protein